MAEPGWRTAWVARLSWLSGYEKPPVMAGTRPVLFSRTTTAPCTTGRTRRSARAAVFPLPSVTRVRTTSLSVSLRCARILERERQIAPVGQPDTPRLALLAGRFLQHDGGRPVHIIKWQPRSRERPLPSRPLVAGPVVGLDA